MSQAEARVLDSTSDTLNGLVPQALVDAVTGIAADPVNGQLTFRATTAWQGSLRSRTDVVSYDAAGQTIPRRHQIMADEPLEVLGENSAPNPQDLLLAALASCMMVGFVVKATAAGIRLDSVEIDTECALDLRGVLSLDPSVPPGAEKIKYTIRVKGDGTPAQFAEIHQQVTETSPNYYHLKSPMPFEAELVVE